MSLMESIGQRQGLTTNLRACNMPEAFDQAYHDHQSAERIAEEKQNELDRIEAERQFVILEPFAKWLESKGLEFAITKNIYDDVWIHIPSDEFICLGKGDVIESSFRDDCLVHLLWDMYQSEK